MDEEEDIDECCPASLESGGILSSTQSSCSQLDPSAKATRTQDENESSSSSSAILEPTPNNPPVSILSHLITGSDFETMQNYLTSGCSKLDKFLCGGFPSFGITELVGESGNGKTQLCLQLALTVQLPESHGGFASGAVYINTESSFPSKRLAELCEHFKTRFGDLLPPEPMNHIIIEQMNDAPRLLDCVTNRLQVLAKDETKPFRLIIIDSIAALFRSDYDDVIKRAMDMRLIGKALHDIANQLNATVIVVNQVTGSVNGDQMNGNVPSLGMAWKNMVTNRIQISRDGNKRSFDVVFSPYISRVCVPFELTSQGIIVNV